VRSWWGRVGHELPLGAQRARESRRHVVEGRRHLALLRRPFHACARIEIAACDLARGRRQAAQRPRQRAGQQPRETEPEQEDDRGHAHQGDRVLAHLGVDVVDALGDAHGALGAARVDDRHRGEQEVLA